MDDKPSTASSTTTASTTDIVAPTEALEISMDWMDRSGHDGREHDSIQFPVGIDPGIEQEITPKNAATAPTTLMSSGVTIDEESGALLRDDFNATCRLAARLGAAAMNCGSIADNIERFLPELMAVYGYYGFFRCSTQEMSCNFETKDPQETIVRTQNVAIEAGNFQLTKLAMLSDLAKDLMERTIDIQEANHRLDEILATPDPWGKVPLAIAFMVIGASLPALLSASWWNVLVGIFAGGIGYGMILAFDAWPDRVHVWLFLSASFLCSMLGSSVQLVIPEVDPTVVTLSGVAILIPSTMITLGINDLVSNHILSGFERLIKGLVIMTWIAIGYASGMSFINFLVDQSGWNHQLETVEVDPIPFGWQLFFLPCIASSLVVIFQMSGKDARGAVLCIIMGYLTSYIGVLVLDKPYVPSLLGSLSIALYANIWSRFYDRPNTIILFPAFQLVVAGIVGFMGLSDIIQGNTQDGGDQVLHMLIVAAIVIIGFLMGGTLVQPYTTI